MEAPATPVEVINMEGLEAGRSEERTGEAARKGQEAEITGAD